MEGSGETFLWSRYQRASGDYDYCHYYYQALLLLLGSALRFSFSNPAPNILL